METVWKAAAVAVIASLLAVLLRKNEPEISLLTVLASAVVILMSLRPAVTGFVDFAARLAEKGSIEPASLSAMLKALAIAITTRVASDVCRDAGETAASSAVEICGAVVSLYIAIPLMEAVMNAVEGLL